MRRPLFCCAVIASLFTLAGLFFIPEAKAITTIEVDDIRCIINVTVHKEFHIASGAAISKLIEYEQKQIEKIQGRINKLVERIGDLQKKLTNPGGLRRAWNWYKRESGFDAEADIRRDMGNTARELGAANKSLAYHQRRLGRLQDALAAEQATRASITPEALENKIRTWKQYMEDLWNRHNFTYVCCKTRFHFEFEIRDEADRPTRGYDQITIMLSSGWRSNVGGWRYGFNTRGFSNEPYKHDMSGEWAYSDPRENFMIPHECGHEMGLKDQYEDKTQPDGTVVSEGYDNHENDLMNAPTGTGAAISNINNVRTILLGRNIVCPDKCCRRRDRTPWIERGLRLPRPDVARTDDDHHGHEGTLATPTGPDAVSRPDTTPDTTGRDGIILPEPFDPVISSTDSTIIEPDTLHPSPLVDADTSVLTDPGKGPDAASPPPDTMPVPAPQPSVPPDGSTPVMDPGAGFNEAPSLDLSNYVTTTLVPGVEEVKYVDLEGDRTKCGAATLYKPTSQGMDVVVSTVVTGKGSDFRKWKICGVRMDIDGEVITPDKEEDFSIEKDSYYREAAAVTLAAIGSQCRCCADRAQSGEVCPVTGQRKGAVERKDGVADGIDSAGMAAGMGLLASQARGSIPAKKITFKLNREQAKKVLDKKGILRVAARNETAHQEQIFKVPLH